MLILIIIIAAIVIGVVSGVSQDKKRRQRLEEEAEMLNLNTANRRSASSLGNRLTTQSAINHQCDLTGMRFAISPDRKTAYLLYSQTKPTRAVPVKDITGCEIIKDGNASGHIGRAVAGGIIAGGAGAIVGASTGSGVPERYSLVVYINDLQNPFVEYPLMDRSTAHSKFFYENVSKFAESVSATIRVIVSQNQEQ